MRPIVRYYGGKWNQAKWIISFFPTHKVYVEPYAGAASVFLQKPESYSEIYNDISGDICNLFRMARDRGEDLGRLLKHTLFSRDEFDLAYEPTKDDLERARRMVSRCFMGFGSDSAHRKSGFRSNVRQSGVSQERDWKHYGDAFSEIVERLRGVCVENKPALDIIKKYDKPDTLFYVDPPYVHDSRVGGERYLYEMSDKDHRELAAILNKAKGMVMLSGYKSILYSKLYKGWHTEEKKTLVHYRSKKRGSERIEVLWMNFAPAHRLFN